MNRQQKTWIRVILVMSSVMATFLGLQMFILVDLQKYQALDTVIVNASTEIVVADSGSVTGDAPPLVATTVATDPPPPELISTTTPTAVPTVDTPTATAVVSTATATEVAATPTTAAVASAPLVTITQNQTQVPTAQAIVPPAAVLVDSQSSSAIQNTTVQSSGLYVDGSYMGNAVQTHRWGTTQVQAIVQNGQLVDVEIIQYPNHTDRSARISLGALPTLVSEAIQNQSANVDIVTRATDTSRAFIFSLQSALADATS